MAQRKTILIIDDEAELRGELAEQLDLHDEFTAAQAESGEEGVRQAAALKPALTACMPTCAASMPAADSGTPSNSGRFGS